MDYLVSFGDWLRQRREALRLTRPDLAECAGCSVSALRKIEADERRPSRQLAELLGGCLRISTEEQPVFLDAARGIRPVARLGRPTPRLEPLVSPPVPAGASSSNLVAQAAWNLPAPATPLVGREAELAMLEQLLSNPNCRLLTLFGPGGIGKTRLAIEAARLQWERFADGVFLASLADADSSEYMVPTIAQAVGLNFSGPADPRVQLVNYLSNKQVLLLLDNLEHLLDGVDLLVEMLEEAPGLMLLVTSRERLDLQAEWVFEVQGLPVPAEDEVDGVEKYSSIQLFLQRARQARNDFELSAEECAHVVRICRLVEGLPLALELAAAWVPVLSCAEIAWEIEQGLDILAARLRDVPERQRSIRAVFDHSWKLLTDEDRRMLRQLSVFRGGFQRETAEAVAGADLPLLSALVSKSFLRRTSTGRFTMHELVRQYVGGRLVEDSEEELDARRRHCHYFADLLARLDRPFRSAQMQAAREELMAELDNIRVAWQWAAEHQELGQLRRMWPCLYWFYESGNLFQEGVSAFRQALEATRRHESPDAEPEQVAAIGYLIGTLGWFSFRIGEVQQASDLLRESLALVSQFSDPLPHLHTRAWLGYVTWAMGDADEVRRVMSDCLLLARQIGSPWHAAIPRVLLGIAAHAQGEYEEAHRHLSEALDFWRAAGDPRLIAFALANLGATNFALSNVEEAEALLRDSIALNQEIDERWGQTYALNLLAQVLCAQRQCAEALHLLRQSLALSKEIGDSFGEAQTWLALGDTLGALGDDEEAGEAYRTACTMALEGQVTPVLIGAALGVAEVCQRQGQPDRALDLLLQVLPHRATSEQIKPRAEQLYRKVVSQLRPEQVEAVRTNAQHQSLETVLASNAAPSPDHLSACSRNR